MRAAWLTLLAALGAGCLGVTPEPPQPEYDLRRAMLFDEPFALSAAGSSFWDGDFATQAEATSVEFTLHWRDATGTTIRMDLDGCASSVAAGHIASHGSFTIGCGRLRAGDHRVTLSMAEGTAQGDVTVTGTVKVPREAAP